MEAHDQILHGLLDMGQMLLLCGAEINRVEDTMTRRGADTDAPHQQSVVV